MNFKTIYLSNLTKYLLNFDCIMNFIINKVFVKETSRSNRLFYSILSYILLSSFNPVHFIGCYFSLALWVSKTLKVLPSKKKSIPLSLIKIWSKLSMIIRSRNNINFLILLAKELTLKSTKPEPLILETSGPSRESIGKRTQTFGQC